MGFLVFTLKDQFTTKRFRSFADALLPAKRGVIQRVSAFRSMLNVSPFNV
jgi:hypothetical protein